MPLVKGKSEKSFVKNLKTEMEHGHPQKQSLAIAYAMKRKAQRKKMADGGESKPEPTPDPTPNPYIDPDKADSAQKSMRQAFGYAEGGDVKGVHMPHKSKVDYDSNKGGQSLAGDQTRWAGAVKGPMKKTYKENAKEAHEKVLTEMKSMPKPKLQGMAEGGFIKDNYQSPCHEHCNVPCEIHEQASGYHEMPMEHERDNEMAMSEDSKRLNQHPVDMHAETSMAEEDLVDRIMHKRKMMSEGGQVANQEHGENNNSLAGFDPNEFDDLVLRDDLESTYGDDDNAGDDLGNRQEDEDRSDMVDRIMLKNFKQKIPRGYPGR